MKPGGCYIHVHLNPPGSCRTSLAEISQDFALAEISYHIPPQGGGTEAGLGTGLHKKIHRGLLQKEHSPPRGATWSA